MSNINVQAIAPAINKPHNLDNLKVGFDTIKKEYERAIGQLKSYDRKLQILLLIWTALLSVFSLVFTSLFDMENWGFLSKFLIGFGVAIMLVALLYILLASMPIRVKRFDESHLKEWPCTFNTQEEYLENAIDEYYRCIGEVNIALRKKSRLVRWAYIVLTAIILIASVFAYVSVYFAI